MAASAALCDPALTSNSVVSAIAKSGAKTILDHLYEDQRQWNALLAAIATGQEDWLRIAKKLRRVSDAGAREQLELAAGEALEHRPASVLSIIAADFGIASICGAPHVDDSRFDSYELSIKTIERRQELLRTIRDPRLRSQRDACLSTLEEAKKHIARFYGRS